MPREGAEPLLRVTNLLKIFPGLTALGGVDLDVHPGEIVSLVGHNGSGKSTLIKILAGVYTADGGEVHTAEGTELHFIHQDLALIEQLSASENLALARGDGLGGIAPYRDHRVKERTRELISRFGPLFDIERPLRRLSPAQRAIVAISRALDGWTHSANVLFLDEPTESLHRSEVEVLFEAVRRLAAEGTGIVFVSHRLDEVLSISDRVVVLRDGRKVADEPATQIDESRLVGYIAGATADEADDTRDAERLGEVVLDVRGLRGGSAAHVDLQVRAGEIVGVAGVLGSGREPVPSLIYGATEGVADEFSVSGSPYPRRSPTESLRRGIVFAPGDRARLAIVREMNARENLTLPHLRRLRRGFGRISPRREREAAQRALEAFHVRPLRTEQRISLFSGGNQQKLVMARSLHHTPRVLLLDEPTQGVDIGAKAAIYAAVTRGAADGAAVVVSSSDAKELLTVCDRVVVMREGVVAATLSGADLTEQRLIAEGYGLA